MLNDNGGVMILPWKNSYLDGRLYTHAQSEASERRGGLFGVV